MKRPMPVLSILVTPAILKIMMRFASRRTSLTQVGICSLSGPIITLPAIVTTTISGAISLWLISINTKPPIVRRSDPCPSSWSHAAFDDPDLLGDQRSGDARRQLSARTVAPPGAEETRHMPLKITSAGCDCCPETYLWAREIKFPSDLLFWDLDFTRGDSS